MDGGKGSVNRGAPDLKQPAGARSGGSCAIRARVRHSTAQRMLRMLGELTRMEEKRGSPAERAGVPGCL